MGVRAWLYLSGLAVGVTVTLTAAIIVPVRVEQAGKNASPEVISARSSASKFEHQLQLPRDIALDPPVFPLIAVTPVVAGHDHAQPSDDSAVYLNQNPSGRIGEVRYAVRARMEGGGSVRRYVTQRCAEDIVLRVHAVSRASDLTDSWIDGEEYNSSGAHYRSVGVARAPLSTDYSDAFTVFMGPHDSAHLALLANDAILATVRVTPENPTVTFSVTRSRIHDWLGSMDVLVLDAGSNRPIVGARVAAHLAGVSLQRRVPEQFTDRYGRVRLSHFPAHAIVYVTADGYRNSQVKLTIYGGGHVTTASVLLAPEPFISGWVTDGDGRPMRARIEISTSPTPEDKPRFRLCSNGVSSKCISNPDTGEFKTRGLASRVYWIRLGPAEDGRLPDPSIPPLQVDTRNGSARHVMLTWYPKRESRDAPVDLGPLLATGPPRNPAGGGR